jgi:hypothetical protein
MVETINIQKAYTPSEASKDKENADSTPESDFSFFGDDGVTFLDFIDMINPLQHIPIVETAYRALTGDEIDPGSRLIGGTLFGGPIGLAASAFNVILENNTGKDVGEHVLALFEGDEVPPEGDTQLAKNASPTNPMVSGFAPMESEEAAFAAGDASLRMADLYEFMNVETATQVQVTADPNKGAGSAGTWAPTQGLANPFATERVKTPEFSSFNVTPASSAAVQVQTQTQPKPLATQNTGFQAKQTYDQSVDSALQAFARDMQIQKSEQKNTANPPPSVPPLTTSSLNQTSDNAWFTDMMSQNMERYKKFDRTASPQG